LDKQTENPRLLEGRTIMVTGSSSGIGRSTALKIAKLGADVIVHSRFDTQPIQTLQQEVADVGGKARAIFADFSKPDSLQAFVQSAWSWKGKIDGWVNNAGGDVLTGDWAERSLTEKLSYLMQVDVSATLQLSRMAGERMRAAWDADSAKVPGAFSMVNIGWDQAWQGMAGDSGELFATTKGSIMSMSKSLAQSFAPAVRVNCVAPGWIQTQWGEQTSEYWNRRAKSESLMQRWGQPEDVASAIAWLVSDESSFVSGQTINVNGGFRYGCE
jgi:3-oxoacyl-[acyl-carrier protein] reductase